MEGQHYIRSNCGFAQDIFLWNDQINATDRLLHAVRVKKDIHIKFWLLNLV